MGRPSGPKPKPTQLKIITGTLEASRWNKREPKPQPAKPTPPEEIKGEALVEWNRVVDELFVLGIITQVDRAVLACYCLSYATLIQAERTLAQMAALDTQSGGLLVNTVNGNTIMNPVLCVRNRAMADVVKFSSELGMSPSARSRVEARPPEQADPAAKYLA